MGEVKHRDEVVYVVEREKSCVIEQFVTFFFGNCFSKTMLNYPDTISGICMGYSGFFMQSILSHAITMFFICFSLENYSSCTASLNR